MLDDFIKVLDDLGQLEGSELANNSIDVNLQWSHCLTAQVYTGSGKKFFVKVAPADSSALRNEISAYQTINEKLAGRVPEYLGCIRRGERGYLVLSHIDSIPIRNIEFIFKRPLIGRLWADVFQDLRACAVSNVVSNAISDLDEQLKFLATAAPELANYASSKAISTILEVLPCIAQHGDLVANNVGLGKGSVVVYDWEDYGRIGLPGMDVALLVGSFLGHAPHRVLEILDRNSPARNTIESWVVASGLTLEVFRQLLPIYYGCFFWLKQSYSENIRNIALKTATEFSILLDTRLDTRR